RAGLLMIVDQRQIGRGPQMANRATEPEPQGQSESYLVADDAGDTARLLDHFAHPVERFHVEGDEDSVSGAQPHIVPSCNRRLCESAISKPAAFVRPRKVVTCAHDHSEDFPQSHQRMPLADYGNATDGNGSAPTQPKVRPNTGCETRAARESAKRD